MPLTVEKALSMDIFTKCKALTGAAGLQNEIRWVNILEILDDLGHIEAGELLITTAYDFNLQNESRQNRLIEQLAGKQLAALAIQTGHYLNEIPSSFIKLAVEFNIPVIEIPKEVSFKSLTRGLMGRLVLREMSGKGEAPREENSRLQDMIRQGRELMQKMLAGENPVGLKDQLLRLHINPDGAYFVLAIRAKDNRPPGTPPAADQKLREAGLLEQGLARLLIQLNLPFLFGPAGQDPTLLIQTTGTGPAQVISTARRLINELDLLNPDQTFSVGLSSLHDHLDSISTAHDQASKTLHLSELKLVGESNMLCYSDLGIHKLLLEVQSIQPLMVIIDETVAPLLAYDRQSNGALLSTLRAYLKHFSISKAARELFVHRHTMKYRLNQIEELTGLKLDLPGNSFQLYLGVQVFEYLRARELI